MKILVCGGRDFIDRAKLFSALDELHSVEKITTLVHGGARGADSLANAWAEPKGIPIRVYNPDWSIGKMTGALRNQEMLDSEAPDLVVAFEGGNGTADMVYRAKAQGYKVLEIV